DAIEEIGGGGLVLGDDGVGVARAVLADVRDGGVEVVDDPDRKNGGQELAAPVVVGGGRDAGDEGDGLRIAAQLAAGGGQALGHGRQQACGAGPVDQQGLGRAADGDTAHLGVHDHVASHADLGRGVQIGVVDAFEVTQDGGAGLGLDAGDQ